MQLFGRADPIPTTAGASIGVTGLTQFPGPREEASAVGVAPPDAKCFIDDAVHPCPLVPREGSSEADGRIRARKPVGVAHQFFPCRAELDFIEAAMPTCQRVAFEDEGAFEQIGMMGGEPERSHVLLAGQKKHADLIGTQSAPSTAVMMSMQSCRVHPSI